MTSITSTRTTRPAHRPIERANGLVGSGVLELGHHGFAGDVGGDDVIEGFALCRADLAMHPLPAVGLDRRLLREPLAFQGQDQVAVQGQREWALCHAPQPARTAREHVQEHAEIDCLADSGRPQHPDEPRRLDPGPDRFDHLGGQEARVAGLTLVGLCPAERAREVAAQAIKFIRVRICHRVCPIWGRGRSWSADTAHRNPMFSRRASSPCPVTNWHVASVGK